MPSSKRPDRIRADDSVEAGAAARKELLRSLRSPHPETSGLVDTGIRLWSDVPKDEMLVDVTKGTGVRWIEGQGWVEDSA